MSSPLFNNALRDASKLYFLMVVSGITAITMLIVIIMLAIFWRRRRSYAGIKARH